jgi:hypothetical protein
VAQGLTAKRRAAREVGAHLRRDYADSASWNALAKARGLTLPQWHVAPTSGRIASTIYRWLQVFLLRRWDSLRCGRTSLIALIGPATPGTWLYLAVALPHDPELLYLDAPAIELDLVARARHGRRWDGRLGDGRLSGSLGTKIAGSRTTIQAPRPGGG